VLSRYVDEVEDEQEGGREMGGVKPDQEGGLEPEVEPMINQDEVVAEKALVEEKEE
jgi:hypothetical protein